MPDSAVAAHHFKCWIDIEDGLRVDAGKLHDILSSYGIPVGFEIYSGTHTSAVADRFQNHVIPFFSKNLCFAPGCKDAK